MDKEADAIPTQAVDSHAPVAQAVPIPDHKQNAELDTDDGGRSLNKDNEEPVSVQAEQLVIDAAEEMYVIDKGEKLEDEFGVQDATDMDSDVEERQIDIVLEIKLYLNVYSLPLAWSSRGVALYPSSLAGASNMCFSERTRRYRAYTSASFLWN